MSPVAFARDGAIEKGCNTFDRLSWIEAKPWTSIAGDSASGTQVEISDGTRRVKDILTPLGAAPHPPRSLALAANRPFAIVPKQAVATSHSQIPHARRVP